MREEWEHLCERGFHGEAVAGAELVDFTVLDELVGPADADDGNSEAHVETS